MPGLIAIPLFTLAGYLLGESAAPKRLVRLSNALLGWLPGGLAIVAIVACAFFTAFTGASGVTIDGSPQAITWQRRPRIGTNSERARRRGA